MKKTILPLLFVAFATTASLAQEPLKTPTMEQQPILFGQGQPLSAHFTGEAWIAQLSQCPSFDCSVYNVTFAPGVRNDWHVHAVGQILLCTEGEGYYQAKGSPAQKLYPGSVVEIPAGVEHWHGAAPHSRFTHVGITPRAADNQAQWRQPVTDEEYREAVQ